LLLTAFSCVSAPILPQQQLLFALISEFNVQMLYLPGLKNVIGDFLFHWSHLELLPPQRQQIQLTLKPWLLSKIPVQKCSVCLAVHLSKLGFRKQALNAWLATFQLEFSTPLSQQNSEETFFTCTIFPTLGGSPLSVLCLLDLSGSGSPTTRGGCEL
jgi:hypothetical protein